MTKNIAEKGMYFRLDNTLYRKLKKLSHLTEKHMSVIIRESLEEKVKEYKNILNNSDIAI